VVSLLRGREEGRENNKGWGVLIYGGVGQVLGWAYLELILFACDIILYFGVR
jgi:hypothetical protein